MNHRQSVVMLHFIVLIFGFTGILGKLISLEAESAGVLAGVFRRRIGGDLVVVSKEKQSGFR